MTKCTITKHQNYELSLSSLAKPRFLSITRLARQHAATGGYQKTEGTAPLVPSVFLFHLRNNLFLSWNKVVPSAASSYHLEVCELLRSALPLYLYVPSLTDVPAHEIIH